MIHLTGSEEIDQLLIQMLRGQKFPKSAEFYHQDTWQQLYKRAERHGLSSLIYWSLLNDVSSVPEQIFLKFKQSYLTTLGRNRIFLSELERVVSLLGSQSIQIVLFKGAVFVHSLYEDIGLRPMSDLDILVHKQDIPKAVTMLKEKGYEEPTLLQTEMMKKDVTHDVHLRQSEPPHVDIEVHWLLGGGEKYRQKVDMEWFWNRIVPLEKWGQNVFTLSPTAHLLYLCGHLGYQHGLASIGLLWLVDVARFLNQYSTEIRWDEFVEGAKHLSWSAAAYYTFGQVKRAFDCAPPDEVLERLSAQMSREEEDHVRSMSVISPTRVALALKQFEQLQPSARLRTVISRAFPSLGFMRERYGFRTNWQAVIGYPVRWVDLTRMFLVYVWSRIKGKRKKL